MSTTTPIGSLSVTHCDDNGTWLIALHGEHDLSTAPLVELQTGMIWPLCSVAVIDLSAADLIDSSVIKWIMRAERQLEASGAGTLSIVEGPPGTAAARLLGRLGMSQVLACIRP